MHEFRLRFHLSFVPTFRFNNIPLRVQMMALRRLSDKPLSEPVMVSLLSHMCVTRPQWVTKNRGYTFLRVEAFHVFRMLRGQPCLSQENTVWWDHVCQYFWPVLSVELSNLLNLFETLFPIRALDSDVGLNQSPSFSFWDWFACYHFHKLFKMYKYDINISYMSVTLSIHFLFFMAVHVIEFLQAIISHYQPVSDIGFHAIPLDID